MTTVTFVFLALFTWMVSSGTWFNLDRCTELSQYGHYEEGKAFSASCKNADSDKTKITLTYERSSQTGVALEETFLQKRMTKDYPLFYSVSLNCVPFKARVNPLQRAKNAGTAETENSHVCKCKMLPCFPYKTSCIVLTIEIKSDNQSRHLNYRNIRSSSALLRSVSHCVHIITHFLVYHWKTMDCICTDKACKLGFVYREFRPAFQECLIIILSHQQVSPVSSEGSKRAYIKLCCVKMPSNCPKEVYPTPAVGTKITVRTGRGESVRPKDSSSWVGRFFLAAVLLLAIYTTRVKISSNRVSPAHDSNSTMVMLFTLTMRCFSPSAPIRQPSEWTVIAVCLSCALGRTVHMLIACVTAHTVMKRFCPIQQQFRSLPVTVLLVWLTFSAHFPNKNVKHWSKDTFVEGSVGSTGRSCAVVGQIELLATLYCVFVSLCNLLQSILTELNFLSVLFHVQLVIWLQNSRIPTKYVLVIQINRLI